MLRAIKSALPTIGFFGGASVVYATFMAREMERQKDVLEKANPGRKVSFHFGWAPNAGMCIDPVLSNAGESVEETGPKPK